jgi:peptidoglycan/xylan/chitin deacetylase (PgdA/CDA1 family)
MAFGMLRTKLRAFCEQIRAKWLEASARACRGVVLMFHEVHEDDDAYLRELKTGCTASFLESIILQLRRDRWDIVTLDEALWRLEHDDPSRRFAVLTFDDGYRDMLTRALAVLERYQAPFTAYVPTAAPTRKLYSWWLGLRALFQRHDRVAISGTEMLYECRANHEKIRCRAEVSSWVHADYRRVFQLQATLRAYDISLETLNDAYFLDEAELRTLARHPLVTIGAHTMSHAALGILDVEEARREMTGSRDYLERLLNRPIHHFAYPYGGLLACGSREFALAGDLGFRTAVTTRDGPIFAAHRMTPHAMPRVGVSGTTAHFDFFAQSMRRLRNAAVDDFSNSLP